MSQSLTTKCDFCGKQSTVELDDHTKNPAVGFTAFVKHVPERQYASEVLHLCDACKERIVQWRE